MFSWFAQWSLFKVYHRCFLDSLSEVCLKYNILVFLIPQVKYVWSISSLFSWFPNWNMFKVHHPYLLDSLSNVCLKYIILSHISSFSPTEIWNLYWWRRRNVITMISQQEELSFASSLFSVFPKWSMFKMRHPYFL